MRDGQLEGLGRLQDLYSRPETHFIASFFGWHNIVEVAVVGYADGKASVAWRDRRLSVAVRAPVAPGHHGLVVPTRALRRASESDRGTSIHGEVIERLNMGDEVRVRVRLPNLDLLTAHLATERALGPASDTLELTLDEDRLSVVPQTGKTDRQLVAPTAL